LRSGIALKETGVTDSSIDRVRGKFKVNSITRHRGSRPPKAGEEGWQPCELQTVKLSPVMGGSAEDNTYSSATPSGSIELSITNPDTVGFFDLDAPYYVDFARADPPVSAERTVDYLMRNTVKGSDFKPR
jgi:hypothetical protein